MQEIWWEDFPLPWGENRSEVPYGDEVEVITVESLITSPGAVPMMRVWFSAKLDR